MTGYELMDWILNEHCSVIIVLVIVMLSLFSGGSK